MAGKTRRENLTSSAIPSSIQFYMPDAPASQALAGLCNISTFSNSTRELCPKMLLILAIDALSQRRATGDSHSVQGQIPLYASLRRGGCLAANYTTTPNVIRAACASLR